MEGPIKPEPKVILNIPQSRSNGMSAADQVAAERRKREEPTMLTSIASLRAQQMARDAANAKPTGTISKKTAAIITTTVGAVTLLTGLAFGIVSKRSSDASNASNNNSPLGSAELTAVPMPPVADLPTPTATEVPAAIATATATAAETASAIQTAEPSVEPLPEASAPAVVAPTSTYKWQPKPQPSIKPSAKPLPGGIMRDVPF
jgi:hypothetical protein